MMVLVSLLYAVCVLFCLAVGVGICLVLWTVFRPVKR